MSAPEIGTAIPAPNPIEIFFSYSHKDQALREELESHLRPLQDRGLINSWYDHAIPAGEDWESHIDERLASAQIVLLLISADFMSSRHCQIETARALERRKAGLAKVVPVMLRHVDWHDSPLAKLQALPKDGRPVTNWPDRDHAFKEIAIGVKKLAEALQKKQQGAAEISGARVHKVEQYVKGHRRFLTEIALLACLALAAAGYFGFRSLAQKNLARRNWARAHFDDKAFSNCRGVQACMEMARLAQELTEIDWRNVNYDFPLLATCMGFEPCLQRANQANQLKTANWSNVKDDSPLLRDCMDYPECLERASRSVLAVGSSSRGQTQYYAAIDLGSKGTKATLFSLHKNTCPREFLDTKSDLDVCQIYKKTVNTKLVSSMKDGQFTDAGIQDATNAVEREVSGMRAAAQKNRLDQVKYFIVGSSGVAKARNKDALRISVMLAAGVDMSFMDWKREGYYGLISSITRDDDRARSLHVNIGSGNTELGCLVGGSELDDYRGTEIEYGSVSGRNRAEQSNPNDIAAGIHRVMHEEVGPAYNRASLDTPCLRNRHLIYWTGGAAWATATLMHPEHALDNAVPITPHDLDTFLARLANGTWKEENLPRASGKDAGKRDPAAVAAEKDRNDVIDVFSGEDLMSGVEIMKTVFEFSNRSATLVFVRDSNFLFSYVKERYPEPHPSEPSYSGTGH